jgi:ribonuclease HII
VASDRCPGWSSAEQAWRAAGVLVAGVDEVGRGPLAGPVVACAVVMPPDAPYLDGVTDSKRLSATRREALAVAIRAQAVGVGLGAASVREIAALNILGATTLAMRRALAALGRAGVRPGAVLVDGRPVRGLGVAHEAVVGGDATVYAISCASIVAKVTRDRLMGALAARYPAYGWERNAGYGSVGHRAAIVREGPTAHHRALFLRKVLGPSSAAGGGPAE